VKVLLNNLPCFNHIDNISEITSGLSQHCFKVSANGKTYFAKTIQSNTEVTVALNAAKHNFSPAVVYYDSQWLITDYIESKNLSLSTMTTNQKITEALKMMVSCHQLNAKIARLMPKDIIGELIDENHFSSMQKATLMQLAQQILPLDNDDKNDVCCHGDINFSNVLIDNNNHAYLIDYECSCLAPAEYDLAMFIAINNIDDNKIPAIIHQYQSLLPLKIVSHQKLKDYLYFSCFINSLWFYNGSQNQQNPSFKSLHKQQWERFIASISLEQERYEHLAKLFQF